MENFKFRFATDIHLTFLVIATNLTDLNYTRSIKERLSAINELLWRHLRALIALLENQKTWAVEKFFYENLN